MFSHKSQSLVEPYRLNILTYMYVAMISSLSDPTLHSIDAAVLSSSNWVLELLKAAQDLETAIEEQITQEDIFTFQEKIGQCFIHQLRDNITSRFTSSEVGSSFSIFDPRNVPVTYSPVFFERRRCY